jgi:hypothetical protein
MGEGGTNGTYAPTDFVVVDPETSTIISKVEWDGELPKARKGSGKRKQAIRPWGTYRSVRNTYRLEGKRKDEEKRGELDEVLPKVLENLWG